MALHWLDSIISVILSTPLSPVSSPGIRTRPSTSEAKWFALRLALLVGRRGAVGRYPSAELCKSIGISKRKGLAAFRDLEVCGWIRSNRFDPDLALSDFRVPNMDAIRRTLTNDDNFVDALGNFASQGLKPNNALLLATLLFLARADGCIHAVSNRMLSRLTGFNPKHQLKTQMQRLQELGFVGLVVPGVNGKNLLRTARSCIYLNLLHPCWQGLYESWSGFAITRGDWKRVASKGELTGFNWLSPGATDEINSRSEIRVFFNNVLLLMISEMMSMPSVAPVSNGRLRARVVKVLAPSGISEDYLTWFMTELLKIAVNLLDELFVGRTPACVEEGGWLFSLRPAHIEDASSEASDSEIYAVLTTNGMLLGSRYACLPGPHSPLKLWIKTGFLPDPVRAWPKFRSGLHAASRGGR